MTKTVSRHNLPPDAFPFRIELNDKDTGELLWSREVTGPAAIQVPGFAPRTVEATMVMRDGTRYTESSEDPQVVNVDAGTPLDEQAREFVNRWTDDSAATRTRLYEAFILRLDADVLSKAQVVLNQHGGNSAVVGEVGSVEKMLRAQREALLERTDDEPGTVMSLLDWFTPEQAGPPDVRAGRIAALQQALETGEWSEVLTQLSSVSAWLQRPIMNELRRQLAMPALEDPDA